MAKKAIKDWKRPSIIDTFCDTYEEDCCHGREITEEEMVGVCLEVMDMMEWSDIVQDGEEKEFRELVKWTKRAVKRLEEEERKPATYWNGGYEETV